MNRIFVHKEGNGGFTLMELLVVIAIIGLLASVVLASLNTARTRGADAAIKSNLNNVRVQAEIVYDAASPNAYTNVCADTNVRAQVTAAANTSGVSVPSWASTQASSASQAVCHSTSAGYAVIVPLKSTSASGWCIDSNGSSKLASSTALSSGVVACP